PGLPGSIISCSLEKKSLVDLPNYSALSYCWGDSADTVDILVNLVPIKATTNLENALERLRALGVKRIWADALCINQGDNQERSLQIRNMREIYSKAELTFSWLGGPEEDSAVDGLEFLREKEDWLSQLNVILNPKRKRGWTSKGLQSPDTDEILPHDLEDVYQPYQDQKDAPVICPETAEQPLNNQEGYDVQVPMPVQPPYTASRRCKNHCKRCKIDYCFQALSDLFKREYWRRRWIIQEIAASEDVCVLCGWETLPLEELCIALSQYRTCRFWDDANEDACTFFDIAMKLRRAYQGHEDLHLGEIIPHTKNFRSRDPRDRIFVLLGICSDGPQLVPTPSYHQSPEGVSRDLTRSMLRRYHCFDFLLENHRKTSNPPDMPSWALEWSSYHIPPGFTGNRPDPRITRDMANSVLRGPHHILMMRGTVVGTVIGVTSSISNIFGAENQDHPMISLDVDGNSKQSRVYYQDAQSSVNVIEWLFIDAPGCPYLRIKKQMRLQITSRMVSKGRS
ncbi:hypothetical protein PG999_013021, partial [Apiospora kogelbergensis]